jgi:chromosome segregation ATPase
MTFEAMRRMELHLEELKMEKRALEQESTQLKAHLEESEKAAYDVNGTIEALKVELEEYRSIAEQVGAKKAVSQLATMTAERDHLKTELEQVKAERDESKYRLQVHADLIGEAEHSLRQQVATLTKREVRLREALVKTRRELWYCNEQMKYHGADEGCGVTEALAESEQALKETA